MTGAYCPWYFETKNPFGEWMPCRSSDKPLERTSEGKRQLQRVMRIPEHLLSASLKDLQHWADGMADTPPGVPQTAPDMVDSASDQRTVNNVLRHEYRVLTEDEKAAMGAIKDAGAAFIALLDLVPNGVEKDMAVIKTREAVMWAVNGLTK